MRSCDIIKAAVLIHNFLINCRECNTESCNFVSGISYQDMMSMNDASDAGGKYDDRITFPLMTDNNEPKPVGRKSDEAKKRQGDGEEL